MALTKSSKTLGTLSVLVAGISIAIGQSQSSNYVARNTLITDSNTPAAASVDILARFVAAESKVREALNQHTFKRDVILQTIGPNGEVTGEYIRNSQFIFDDHGKRIERVFYHPKSTIREMRITKEDIQDLAGAQLLGLDIVEAAKYRLSYVGTEIIESRVCHVVDVAPSVQPDPNHMSQRFFIGRVWLNSDNLQIVKIKGIVEPQGKQRFPVFETWREPSANRDLFFPSRTEADDVLHFHNLDVHYRIKVRYYEYKLFGSQVTIKDLDEPVAEPAANPPTSEAPEKKSKNKPSDSVKTPDVSKNFSEKPPMLAKQTVRPQTESPVKPQSCTTNRSAPPLGPYHWPADAEVKVYFLRDMFNSEQRVSLVEAMSTWTEFGKDNGSGVKFTDAGEADRRMSCRGCLTVGRRDVYKQDRHHYAFFHPMEEEAGRLLVSAWIDLDFGITTPKAIKAFMMHELAHGLGLWDCTTCKKKNTIMNGFPGLNKDNGLAAPSFCDVAAVKNVYQEERQLLAAAGSNNRLTDQPQIAVTVPSNLDKPGSSVLNSPMPAVSNVQPTGSSRNTSFAWLNLASSRKASGHQDADVQPALSGNGTWAKSTVATPLPHNGANLFAFSPLDLDKPMFSPLHVQDSRFYRNALGRVQDSPFVLPNEK
jgi:hypothetical protein